MIRIDHPPTLLNEGGFTSDVSKSLNRSSSLFVGAMPNRYNNPI